jgi:membrane protein implicated in regulation of membrane protease activity
LKEGGIDPPSFLRFNKKEGVFMGMIDPALYWLIIGVMLFLLELAVPGFILAFFAAGALLTALVAWLSPVSIAVQLALFITASLVSLMSFRNIIQKKLVSPPRKEGEDKDEDEELVVTGDKGVVSSTIIPPAEGRIKYSGTSWRAIADERIEEGEIVSIVRRKDLVIHVEKV